MRKLVVAALLLAALLCFFLLVTSHTPRARLNVMQFCAVSFFLLVVARHWGRAAAAPGPPAVSIRPGGMWPAIILCAGVWAFTLPVGFINDDFSLVYRAQQAGWEYFWSFLQEQSGVFFRPAGYASIFLDYQIWGLWAPGYRLTNVALHLATIGGLYCLSGELGADRETACGAALIYAVLPVHAEAIAWIGCRFGLLSDALVMAAAIVYLRSRRSGRALEYGAALLCFALATLSKESAFAFPVLLVLFELFFTAQRRILPVAGFVAIAAAIFAGRWVLMGGIGGYGGTLDIGFKTVEGLLIRGPSVMLFGYNWFQPPAVVVSVLASLTAAIVVLLGWFSRKAKLEKGFLVLALGWMVVAIAPAHPLLMIGADLANSRNLHPGTAGLALLAGYLIAKSAPAAARRYSVVLLAGLLAASSFANIAAWRYASRITDGFLAGVQELEPSPERNTAFVFYNVPERIRGVYLLHEGLTEALRLTYGREDLNARHAGPNDTGEVLVGPVIRLEWQGEAEPHVRRVENGAAGN